MIVGRIVFGWFLDRFPVPIVGAAGVLLSVAAQVLLLTLDHFGWGVVLMSILFGASMGAQTDLLSLLVGRYFGSQSLSRIYSWHNVAFLAGAALGPPCFSVLLARSAGLNCPVLTMTGLTLLASALMLTLGGLPQLGWIEEERERSIDPELASAF